MSEENQTPENPLKYVERFLKIKLVHPEVRKIIEGKANILNSLKTSHELSMRTSNDFSRRIDKDLKENEDLYGDLVILSTHLPNYKDAHKNSMTLKQQEVFILADTIVALLENSNTWKKEIVKVVEEAPIQYSIFLVTVSANAQASISTVVSATTASAI